MDQLLRAYVAARSLAVARLGRCRPTERGEGVISTAVAVLVMAALGALMWVGFKQIWTDASSQTADQISKIGQ